MLFYPFSHYNNFMTNTLDFSFLVEAQYLNLIRCGNLILRLPDIKAHGKDLPN